TPATRAAIIETLYKREYVVKNGKVLEATDKGIALVDVVHPDVKSPLMTGEWEAKLKRVQRGEDALGAFMEGIERYVGDVVGKVKGRAGAEPTPGPHATFGTASASERTRAPRVSEASFGTASVSERTRAPRVSKGPPSTSAGTTTSAFADARVVS